jgi:hypothetical protein
MSTVGLDMMGFRKGQELDYIYDTLYFRTKSSTACMR